MLKERLSGYSEWAPLALRLAIGIVFLVHGVQKFGNLSGVAGMFGNMVGLPLPGVMAFIVALVETLGGLALIVGLATRWAALLLSIVMVVSIVTVKISLGLIAPQGSLMPGAELDLALLAGTVALLLLGSGALSVEGNLLKQEI